MVGVSSSSESRGPLDKGFVDRPGTSGVGLEAADVNTCAKLGLRVGFGLGPGLLSPQRIFLAFARETGGVAGACDGRRLGLKPFEPTCSMGPDLGDGALATGAGTAFVATTRAPFQTGALAFSWDLNGFVVVVVVMVVVVLVVVVI
jgi:hypothetical protein